MATYTKSTLKTADAFFLTLALLQREHPEKQSFSVSELEQRAQMEGFDIRKGTLSAHAYGHAAANEEPGRNGKYRMAFREADRTVRLVRKGDFMHPDRHLKIWPRKEEIPAKYHPLVDWAISRFEQGQEAPSRWLDGLFQLRGLGKELWNKTDPDQYVRELREGWE